MNDLRMTIGDRATPDDVEQFWRIHREYNTAQVGASDKQSLYIILHDEGGAVAGGLNGYTLRGWLFVENLAIDDRYRAKGFGTRLIEAAEEEARRRGCHSAYLDTYSFQARPFYEKRGYTVFGTLDDFPVNYQRFFLSKKL